MFAKSEGIYNRLLSINSRKRCDETVKQRIISGATLIAFVAAIVIFNNSFPYALNIVLALVSAFGVWELIAALGIQQRHFLAWPSVAMALVLPFCPDFFYFQLAFYAYTLLIFTGLLFHHQEVSFRELGVIYSMSLLIPWGLSTLVSIRSLENGGHEMFYVIVTIAAAWVADAGAYFVGSFFGKHKLCPNISPKKTIEGAIGGFVVNILLLLLIGFVFESYYQGDVQVRYWMLALIGAGGSLTSMLGDLSFSLIKRSCHIKDFGQVIPGHGGILDRFDSVIFVSPFVYLLLSVIPVIIL